MKLKNKRKPVFGDAIQWFKGDKNPVVTVFADGRAAVNAGEMNSIRESITINDGDYIVSMPDNHLYEVYDAKTFAEKFEII